MKTKQEQSKELLESIFNDYEVIHNIITLWTEKLISTTSTEITLTEEGEKLSIADIAALVDIALTLVKMSRLLTS